MGYLSYYCFDYKKCAKRAQNEGDYHACQDGFYRWALKYVDLERNDPPDSHGGYWVSPVKMMPKLPGITHQITYYSTTKSTTNMDGAI